MKAYTFDLNRNFDPVVNPGIVIREYYTSNKTTKVAKKHYGLPIMTNIGMKFFPILNIVTLTNCILDQVTVQYDGNSQPVGARQEPVNRCSESDRAFLYFSTDCQSVDMRIYRASYKEDKFVTDSVAIQPPTILIIDKDEPLIIQKDYTTYICIFDGSAFKITQDKK